MILSLAFFDGTISLIKNVSGQSLEMDIIKEYSLADMVDVDGLYIGMHRKLFNKEIREGLVIREGLENIGYSSMDIIGIHINHEGYIDVYERALLSKLSSLLKIMTKHDRVAIVRTRIGNVKDINKSIFYNGTVSAPHTITNLLDCNSHKDYINGFYSNRRLFGMSSMHYESVTVNADVLLEFINKPKEVDLNFQVISKEPIAVKTPLTSMPIWSYEEVFHSNTPTLDANTISLD